MCGIVALLSKQEPIPKETLKRATERLFHRGPDGQKYWISPNGRVGLGHARLSIIDLTTGDQPIANSDETLQIVVNGEFYDFERIRHDLEQRGCRFRTHSDSEIALHLYNEFGTQCLHHLRGEFAFVLWDERNQLLFAARDRFGIKPLYYAVIGETLYVASEVKALLAAGVSARWDWESFFQVDSGVLDPNRTLFKGIYQVPPGHFLVSSPGGIQLKSYWDFNYPAVGKGLTQTTEKESIEQLSFLLEEAVRLRLRADVPVAFYLSGGLDSSAILGIAAKYASAPLKTFTISFDQKAYDEEIVARETAERIGAEFRVIPVTQSDLAEHFAETIWHGETICLNAHSVAKYILSQAVRDAGYKVVLTGEGSDEIFAGYAHFRHDMLLYNTQGQDEKQIQQLLEQLQSSNAISRGILLPDGALQPLTSVQKTLGFVPTWMKTVAAGSMNTRFLYSPEFFAQFALRDAYRVFLNGLDVRGQLKDREPVNQSLYSWSKSIFPNYILRVLGDGVEMAHSIEGRLPFLDHHVVELVCQLPVSLKINGMTEKYALREAMRPYLTETVYKREKHPFFAPPSTLSINTPLLSLIQDTLRSPRMGSVPFYDQSKVIAMLDKLPEMDDLARTLLDSVLIKMLSVCVLQEQFGLS